MNFHTWLMRLRSDAEDFGLLTQLHQIPEDFLGYIYEDGCAPSILAITNWCEADPNAILDAREAEMAADEQIAA